MYVAQSANTDTRYCTSVLVVDNDPQVAQLLEELLLEEGYCVESESDGESAIRTIERVKPDVVLADYMIPRLNGLVLLEEIHARWHEINVILMSASAQPSEIPGLFIQKPFDLDVVVETIRRCEMSSQQSA